ncbi:MAG: DUF2339 domain-containing protein [Terricaulis sp.]
MEWLIIIGLVFWVWRQSARIGALSARVNALELRAEAERTRAQVAAQPAPAAAVAQPIYVPETPAAPVTEEEPLLLDTPLPEVSNDIDAQLTPAVAAVEAAPAEEPLLLTDVAPPLAPPPPQPEPRFERWISENGFAWLGAGGFALAGIYLVSYATQQQWFTPGVRLVCAILLGMALIAASEWVRRRARNGLVAALLAGAGAATFYATAWATHGLYHYANAPTAAALLTLCAAILIALSLIHGEALGILAIAAAFLAPPLTSMAVWPPTAITLYVLSVGVAGYALTYVRRWAWAGIATLAGLYFWFAAAIDAHGVTRALTLISIASAGAVALSARRSAAPERASPLTWSQARQFAPSVGVCIGSVMLLWAWLAVTVDQQAPAAGAAIIAIFHVALAAYAVRNRVAAPAALSVAIGALVIGFAIYLASRAATAAPSIYPSIMLAVFVVTVSALATRAHRTTRGLVAASGGIGAALLTLLAATTRADWHAPSTCAPLFAGALLLFGAAWRTAQDIAEPRKDRAVDFWAGAAGVLLLIAVESAFPAAERVVADAVVALGLAAGLARLEWRALRVGALTAAAISIAHALAPDVIAATLQGAMPIWRALLYIGAAATAMYGASRVLARKHPTDATAEALSSAALMSALIGAFLLLRWVAAGGAGGSIDAFTETALRALALIAAGHIALPRQQQRVGDIARWRGHVLMCLGLAYALMQLGFVTCPWWGAIPAQIDGPPLLNGLLLGFAAPAALAFTAANRLYADNKIFARIYVSASGVLVFFWALLELRRDFHPLSMATASPGIFEAACYGLFALAFALAIAAVPRLRAQRAERPFTKDLQRAASACAWGAMVFAAVLMLVTRHPWWGAQDAAASDSLSTGLGVLAQAWAATLALGLGRALSRGRGVDATRFAAAASAAMFALSFGHGAIRWIYHGGGMDEPAPFVQLEGFAHTLWPLVFVLSASAITARAPGRDTVRAYVFDLEAIWSVAIWPALLFAALGLWLLFNPWWGADPAPARTPLLLTLALAAYPLAAAMTLLARRVPHPFVERALAPATAIIVAIHCIVGITLTVRAFFHGVDLIAAQTSDLEMWSYSAAWALFGGVVIGLGTWRNERVIWWAGTATLILTALKVGFFDSANLSGIFRPLSFLGIATVLTLVALGSNYVRTRPNNPLDPLGLGPAARRDRRAPRRPRG